MGDDVHPPWNHASSILAKRLIECLSDSAECFLATVSSGADEDAFYRSVRMAPRPRPSNTRGLTAVRLSMSARTVSPDIVHVVGTNALAFAPAFKLARGRGKIVRHVFTSYDPGDRAVRPLRWLTNALFIESYAFTTPRIGDWARENSPGTRRFLIRPPIDCDLYQPTDQVVVVGPGSGEKTVLYMGPLWGTRFPAAHVLAAMGKLLNTGIKVRLLVLTSAKRSSQADSDKLEAMARGLGLGECLMVRRVDLREDERVAAYNSADVVIFPYVGPVPERLADPPFGILEAMACGGVVLATDVMSISEVLRDGVNGFVVRDSSPGEMASGIQRALTAEEAVRRNARGRVVSDFSYPRIREALLASYSSLMS